MSVTDEMLVAREQALSKRERASYFQRLGRNLTRHYDLYLFIVPAFVVLFIFHYIPIYGIQIGFKDYKPVLGIFGSPWVGLKHFVRFFNSYASWNLIRNTLTLNLYQLAAGFPVPIILALMLNHMRHSGFKRVVQTATYLPHFISVVVVVGMMYIFLSPHVGAYGHIMRLLGLEPQNLLGSTRAFQTLYVISGIWQHAGWDSVIYFAALSTIDPTHYEAAIVDGASKVQRIWHIDLPSILPTMVIILILRFGHMMDVGFEKVYLLQNYLNLDVSEVLTTYVYKVGIGGSSNLAGGQFSFATAVGLFRSVINLFLLVTVNRIARRVSQNSLW